MFVSRPDLHHHDHREELAEVSEEKNILTKPSIDISYVGCLFAAYATACLLRLCESNYYSASPIPGLIKILSERFLYCILDRT